METQIRVGVVQMPLPERLLTAGLWLQKAVVPLYALIAWSKPGIPVGSRARDQTLRDMLDRIPQASNSQLEEFLSDDWKRSHLESHMLFSR